MIDESHFILKTKAHILLIMEAINQAINLFKTRYYIKDKKSRI